MSSSFAELGLAGPILSALSARGIAEPFPIQAATIPDALAGHDICGKAPTGSGKTLAFGLPVVSALGAKGLRAAPGRPLGLVLLPTRELAAQVAKELGPLAQSVGARVHAVYGGVGYGPQRNALRRGVELLAGTPGRLEDLIEQGSLDLSNVRWVVLDEADRMADMGFMPAMRRLLDQIGSDRQVLLFSATLDGDVDKIVSRYMNKPRRHEVVADEDRSGDVTHLWWKIPREKRSDVVADLVRSHAPAVVFCRTRHGADRLARRLEAAGIAAATVHGSRTQPQRDRALSAFSSGAVHALVATDVAARGIHVDSVACVVHFDLPGDHKDYTHRSGRTGRAGANGLVVSLVTDESRRDASSLQKALGIKAEVGEPDFAALPAPVERKVVRETAVAKSPMPHRSGASRRNGHGGRSGSGRGTAGRNGSSHGGEARSRGASSGRPDAAKRRRRTPRG